MPPVKAAPADPWSAINWIALPGGHYPAVSTAEGAGDPNATLVGWHGGFIEFLWDPVARTLTPWVSSNGLTWRSGSRMDLSYFADDFKEMDDQASEFAAETPGPGESPFTTAEIDEMRYGCSFVEYQFEEGPSTFLLRGYLHCGDRCGNLMDSGNDAMWVSPDGLNWTFVNVPKTLGMDAGSISGGSSGFAAVNGAGTQLLISADGITWHSGAFPPGTNRSEAVSFAAGFVMGDAVVLVKGHNNLSVEGCIQSGADLVKYQARFWLSSDGINWTATHTGIVGYGVSVQMTRLDDHLVIGDERSDAHEYQLASTDGKTWTQLNGPLIDTTPLLCGRDQGFIVDGGDSGTVLKTFDSSLKLITVKQTGDLPWDDLDATRWAIGPTGILATADGERFWIGVPSSS